MKMVQYQDDLDTLSHGKILVVVFLLSSYRAQWHSNSHIHSFIALVFGHLVTPNIGLLAKVQRRLILILILIVLFGTEKQK